MASTDTASEPRAAKDRAAAILAVAAPLFAERGYASTDVQDIADAAGVGKGTVYRNFATKEALFLAAVDRTMADLSQSIAEVRRSTPDPIAMSEAVIRTHLAFFDAHPWAVELLIQERAVFRDRKRPTYAEYRDAMLTEWTEVVASLMARGRFRQADPARVLDAVSDLLYGTIFTNAFAGRAQSYEEQADAIVDVLFNGLLSDEERRHRAADH